MCECVSLRTRVSTRWLGAMAGVRSCVGKGSWIVPQLCMCALCVCVCVYVRVVVAVEGGPEHDINLFTQSHCGYPPSSGVQKAYSHNTNHRFFRKTRFKVRVRVEIINSH